MKGQEAGVFFKKKRDVFPLIIILGFALGAWGYAATNYFVVVLGILLIIIGIYLVIRK